MNDVVKFPARVLPSRQLSPDEEWEIIESMHTELQNLLRQVGCYGGNEQLAMNFLRFHFNVRSHTELTIGDMRKAIPMLRDAVDRAQEFQSRIAELRRAFNEQVIGRSLPWTPNIARKVGRRGMAKYGSKPNWEELARQLEAGLVR